MTYHNNNNNKENSKIFSHIIKELKEKISNTSKSPHHIQPNEKKELLNGFKELYDSFKIKHKNDTNTYQLLTKKLDDVINMKHFIMSQNNALSDHILSLKENTETILNFKKEHTKHFESLQTSLLNLKNDQRQNFNIYYDLLRGEAVIGFKFTT